ncbi:MAG: PTS sugar transporter subunit IIA [Chloroflexota bacterium]|nr:PTS sugar transporter subunit IIA [Chloroflexota bacterium]
MKATQEQADSGQPWVREGLVIIPMQAENAADAIAQLGVRLRTGGFVKDSWIQATIEREKAFATGLPTPRIGVAIPHADVEHVLQPGIAVGVLEKPVEFGEMGSPDSTVPVRIVCALAAAHSESLITLLQQLVEIFQQPDVLGQIAEAQSPTEITAVFEHHLQIE